jgi:membrane protein
LSASRPDDGERAARGRAGWSQLLRAAAREWWNDDVFQLAAALAFYTIFSLAPIVSIALWVAGTVFGTQAASDALMRQVQSLIGPNGAAAIGGVVDGARRAEGGLLSSALAVGTLLLGSTAVFGQLQTALNRIWDVEPGPGRSALRQIVEKRLLSFGLVVALGFLLLVSLFASAVLTALHDALAEAFPAVPTFWRVLDVGISFAMTTALFAAVYKVLPDARIAWSDVAVGSIATALLFAIGKYGIGLYLGSASLGSAYGAAGSFVIVVVWVYYSAIVCFFGAEFTQVYARRWGRRIEPAPYAVRRGEKRTELPVPS